MHACYGYAAASRGLQDNVQPSKHTSAVMSAKHQRDTFNPDSDKLPNKPQVTPNWSPKCDSIENYSSWHVPWNRRGMVTTDEAGEAIRDSAKRVVPLVDLSFAQDGLDIWYAMQDWFGQYLAIYYPNDAQVHIVDIKQHSDIILFYFILFIFWKTPRL